MMIQNSRRPVLRRMLLAGAACCLAVAALGPGFSATAHAGPQIVRDAPGSDRVSLTGGVVEAADAGPTPRSAAGASLIPPSFRKVAKIRELTIAGSRPGSSERLVLAFPRKHQPGTPYSVVLFVHGAGGDRFDAMDTPAANVNRALVAKGYLVASGDYWNRWNYGDPDSVDALGRVLQQLGARVKLSSVVVESASMGGLTGLNAILRHKIPKLRGWVGVGPVCSLTAALASPILGPGAQRGWDGAPPELVDQFDPLFTLPLSGVRTLPMMFLVSNTDTIVPRGSHADLCASRFRSAGARVRVLTVAGEHGQASTFDTKAIVRFTQRVSSRS